MRLLSSRKSERLGAMTVSRLQYELVGVTFNTSAIYQEFSRMCFSVEAESGLIVITPPGIRGNIHH